MKSLSDKYYFLRRRDLDGYECTDSKGELELRVLIGESLAHLFCDCSNDLELIRIRRYGIGESVVVRKTPNHIVVHINLPLYYEKT